MIDGDVTLKLPRCSMHDATIVSQSGLHVRLWRGGTTTTLARDRYRLANSPAPGDLRRMSVDFSYLLRKDEPETSFRDLDDVILLVPAGTEGAIVGIWEEGATFEVEFADATSSLATVPSSGLRRVGRHAR